MEELDLKPTVAQDAIQESVDWMRSNGYIDSANIATQVKTKNT